MSKHTPGPWKRKEQFLGWEIYKSDDIEIVVCSEINQGKDGGESDAKLIAAAPELLESVKQFVWNWENDIWTDADIEAAKAAIKKATE